MRLVALVLVAACSAQLSQDHATGPDGVIEGATPVAFVDGVARVRGTVSYPYGDRVDWYVFEVPPGDARIAVKWRAKPDVRFRVEAWNDDHVKIDVRAARRVGEIDLEQRDLPRGKLYVRIYVRNRDEAGNYELAVHHVAPAPTIDWLAIEIPDPPSLPSVPDLPTAAGSYQHPDKYRPMCEGGTCVPAETFVARLINITPPNIVTVGMGKSHGIEATWRAQFFDATTMHLIPDGTITITSVGHTSLVGTTNLAPAQLANVRVLISPP